jgi:hypothetical protein
MVVISGLFVASAKTRLQVGDIVLAVNGVPVWKPEQADREQLAAARASKASVLYCVDMESLRDYFVSIVHRNHQLEGRATVFHKHKRNHYSIKESNCVCTAKVNKETLLFDDETDWSHRFKTYGETGLLHMKTSYSQSCAPALVAVNDFLRMQLGRLSAKVVAHAWEFSLVSNEGDIPTYAMPSAPTAVEIMSGVGGDSIPLATAVAIEDDEEENGAVASF